VGAGGYTVLIEVIQRIDRVLSAEGVLIAWLGWIKDNGVLVKAVVLGKGGKEKGPGVKNGMGGVSSGLKVAVVAIVTVSVQGLSNHTVIVSLGSGV
jgi:hypothetical protein